MHHDFNMPPSTQPSTDVGLSQTVRRPMLHFVHANSFPSGTYREFFDCLRVHYDVGALDIHAHNPKYPVRNGWHALELELIDELTSRYDRPVILAGHSMGGMLGLMVAKARPDLVRCVILLDSPVVAGWRAVMLRIAKLVGADRKFSPARFSEKRRNVWPSHDDAYRHFASKKTFCSWPPEVLRDYVEFGLMPHPEGVTLRFTREAETAVYRGLPHHIGALTRKPFPVRVGFIGGADSIECRQVGLRATRKLTGRHFRKIPGGHLFPMESPKAAADAVHEMIQNLLHS
jgi:pimeloyl-ACP methyl ester carboxylesterase